MGNWNFQLPIFYNITYIILKIIKMIYESSKCEGYVEGYLGSGRFTFFTEYYGKDYPKDKKYNLNDEIELDDKSKGIVIGYQTSTSMFEQGFIVYIPSEDKTTIYSENKIFNI